MAEDVITFSLKGFEDIVEINIITLDEDGNKTDKIGLEDIQSPPKDILLELRRKTPKPIKNN